MSGGRRLEWCGVAIVAVLAAVVLSPVWTRPWGFGWTDWDQMETHRYLADKTIRLFGQVPFWDPYSCGGHTWWGGFENGTIIVPWLPLYLLAPLAVAIRLEITLTTIAGVAGAWLLARRFTRSPGASVLVAIVFALNARFAMQLAVGHTWHLWYAALPWALFFYDRAIASPAPRRDVIGLGITFALMVWGGAIYPLPHAIVILGVYGAALAVSGRTLQPFRLLAIAGAIGVALSAPRLFPMLDTMRRFPRLVASNENIDLARFVAFYTRKASDPHPAVTPWGWHEFGIYVGWIPFAIMIASLFAFRRPRERGLAYAGVLCLLFGFGHVSRFAPWALLHAYVPVFKSQHVPTRWLFPAVLPLLAGAAASAERLLDARSWRPRFEIALLVVCGLVSADVALESRRVLSGFFSRPLPNVAESVAPYHQDATIPPELAYPDEDWAPPALPAMRANVGLIRCGTFSGQSYLYRDATGVLPGLGAHGEGDPDYRGETYFQDGAGRATIARWTPNAVTVRYEGATPGDTLVLNQNWDPGWRATTGAIVDTHDLVAVRVTESAGETTFRYQPRFLWLGIVAFFAAIGTLVATRKLKGFA
ncbi:MAG TPA: hypothetical protein VGH28_17015 [Polyangiaceae bacterium]